MESNDVQKDSNKSTISNDNFQSQKIRINTKEDLRSSIDVADWIRRHAREKVPFNFVDSEEIGIFGDKNEYNDDWIKSMHRKAYLNKNKTDKFFDLYYFKDNGTLMYVSIDPYKIDSVVNDDENEPIDKLNPIELLHKVGTRLIEEIGFHKVFSGGEYSKKIKGYLKLYRQVENSRKNADIFE